MNSIHQGKGKIHKIKCEYINLKNSASKAMDFELKNSSYLRDIFNDSAWKRTPYNRPLFSFERSFGTTSSGRKNLEYPKGGDISSFEQDLILTPDKIKIEAPNIPEVRQFLGKTKDQSKQNLRKRKPEVHCFKHPKVEWSEKNTSGNKSTEIFCNKSGPEFILNLYTNDDFESDSELQKETYLELTKSEIKRDYSQEPVLGFKAFERDVRELIQIPCKRLVDFSERDAKEFMHKKQRSYVCKYCATVFHSGCALGGHISKLHRGVNFVYAQKMAQRQEYKVERDRIKFIKHLLASN
jgi:hypothetical protein